MSGNLYTEFGTSITISFEAEKSVTLSRLNNKFVHKAGDDLYGFLGIDRKVQAETVAEMEHHMLGSVLVKGPAFGLKYQYRINLQRLTKAEYKDLKLMIQLSQAGKLLRLDDKILEFTEYQGRTRAIAPGTASPVIVGNFTSYYASFKIQVTDLTRDFYVRDGQGELEFTAVEYDKPLTV
jgi:hypothetical protein